MSLEPLRYAFLETLPQRLVEPTATHIHGELVPRGRAIVALRGALLAGEVPAPESLAWPAPALREPLLAGLRASGVADYCRGDATLTDEVLSFVLDAVHESHRIEERAIVALSMVECTGPGRCARHGPHCAGGPGKQGEGGEPEGRGGDDAEWRRHREGARTLARQLAVELVRKKTATTWDERVVLWRELADLLAALVAAARLPPGTERGLLRALPLADLQRLRALLAKLSALDSLIRRLGRARDAVAGEGPGLAERVVSTRPGRATLDVEVEGGPGVEIRGIERGADPSRMLPGEALLLRHPTLRRLWHARRIERALLSYHAAGTLTERIRDQQSLETAEVVVARPVERGPVVLLLDTSGSMMGEREEVAKALTLQILGVCYLERRRCYAYSFSGASDVLEEELGLDADGLARLLRFLERSFHGGTEIDESVRRAVARLESSSWHAADLVVFSDGLFVAFPPTRAALATLRRSRGLRVHGVTVADRAGFESLGVDELHDVQEWIAALARG